MKRKILILLLVVLTATGCSSIYSLKTNDLDAIVDDFLLHDSKLANTYFEGYKYYVPRGLNFIDKDQFNAILQDVHRNKYYLYVDAVSYYHKVQKKYKKNPDAYYSRRLEKDNNFGYLEINQVGKKYFIEAMYHYAKVEVYVEEEFLSDALIQVSYLLSSIQYNRNILETLVGENLLNYEEEEFDIFKSKRKKGDFLDYVEEYGKYYDKDNELPDQDQVEIEEEN